MTTAREQLAQLIEKGRIGSGHSKWRLDIVYPVRFDEEDIDITRKAIANFVRDGVMEGSSPAWKVRVDSVIDLDAS